MRLVSGWWGQMTMAGRNIRRTRKVLSFVIFPAGYFLLGYLWFVVHWVFAFGLIAFVLAVVFLANRILRCPKCGASIGRHTYRLFGHEQVWWSVSTPRNCEQCGYDLTGKETAGEGGR